MKKIVLGLCCLLCLALVSPTATAQTNRQLRHAYVMKNLNLNKEQTARFGPVLKAYLDELKEAKSNYDKLKDKYRDMEKAGMLTNSQAEQMLNAKFDADAKELVVKKKFYVEFKKVLPLKKVWYAFDLANDKKSKVRGEEE